MFAYSIARVRAQGQVKATFYPGITLTLDLGDWIQRVYFLGGDEREKRELMKKYLPIGGVGVDVGANIGMYSCTMARFVGESGVVIAYEPMPENVSQLRANVSVNRLENVRTRPVALSSRAGTVRLYVPPGHPGGPSAATQSWDPGNWLYAGSVDATTLDDDFGASRLDLLKIDAQGAELQILEGAVSTLRCHRPVVIAEIQNHHRQQVQDLMHSLEYSWIGAFGDFLFLPTS